MQAGIDGFLNLRKPLGWTSHDCVARVRRLLKTRKVGHAGTLDPAAEGVLPIAVGRATRLLQFLPTGKAYRAIVRFGLTTSTDDLEGEVLTQQACPGLTEAQVRDRLPEFLGTIDQIPPAFSAIQVNGKRLYELARAGQAVEVPLRQVEIFKIEVLAWRSGDFPEMDLEIHCGGGTYIRSIARDLGAALGTGGTLAGLTRTHSSGFDEQGSLTFAEIEAALDPTFDLAIAATQSLLTPVEHPFLHYPEVQLTAEEAWRWGNGQKILPIAFRDIADRNEEHDTERDRRAVAEPSIFRVRLQEIASSTEKFEAKRESRQFLGIGELQKREDFVFLKARMVYANPVHRPLRDEPMDDPMV